MPGVITITYGFDTSAVEQTAAAWGVNAAPKITTRDRSPTVFSFKMAGAAAEDGVPFKFYPQELKAGSTPAVAEAACRVVIKQYSTWTSGTGWSGLLWQFVGYLSKQPAHVSGKGQEIHLEFSDAIWLMQSTTFQQLWNLASTPSSPVYISRCVLFMDINSWVPNQYMSVQWQLNQIISYAATCGIRISAGTIDYSGWFLNYVHTQAASCWDALLTCLKPIPDAKVWVDGTTSTPTLHIRTRAAIAALTPPTTTAPGPITLPFRGTDAAGRQHFSSDSFEPRHDLCPPQVVLQYQINQTHDGRPAPIWTNDVYPATVGGLSDGQMPFAMVCPIDLTGQAITTVTGPLDCESLACIGGSHAAKRAWWASQRGGVQDKLADYRVRFGSATLGDATVTDEAGNDITSTVMASYPRKITDGNHHPWMKNAGGSAVNSIKAHIRVTAKFSEYKEVGSGESDTSGNILRKTTAHELHCHCTLTDAPAGLTNFVGQNYEGQMETPVANLAQNIYSSRATLDYDGQHEIIDPGLPNGTPLKQLIGHWNVLNFSGGAAAWATANMTISGTDIDLQTNHISIMVGPARHLEPQDWNQMLQFFRYRYLYLDSSVRATGYGGANNNVEMAKRAPKENTTEGLKVDSFNAVQATYTPA